MEFSLRSRTGTWPDVAEIFPANAFGFAKRSYSNGPKDTRFSKSFTYFSADREKSKKLVLPYWPTRAYIDQCPNDRRFDAVLQIVNSRYEEFSSAEIHGILEVLRPHYKIRTDLPSYVEYFVDTYGLLSQKDHDVFFTRPRARTTRKTDTGFTEGKRGNSHGGETKLYLKPEKWHGPRHEALVSKDRLINVFSCRTLADTLALDPLAVLSKEAVALLVKSSDWPRIFPDKFRRWKIVAYMKRNGVVAARRLMTKAEKRKFYRVYRITSPKALISSELTANARSGKRTRPSRATPKVIR